jgi:hypothetical protein
MPRPRRRFIKGKGRPRNYPSPKLRVVTYYVDGKRIEAKGEWIPAKTELLHIDPIQDLIEQALYTNWVAREYPASLLLYADFESGKTELQKKYYHNRGVSKRRRFSATGIKDSLLRGRIKINSEKKAGHILIPDMSNVFTYKQSTCKKNMLFIDAFTEEGLDPEDDYFNKPEEGEKIAGVRGGIIAGVNPAGFLSSTKRKIRQEFVEGGGLSRFVLVSWDDSNFNKEIADSITAGLYRNGNGFVKNIQFDFPDDPIEILLPRKLAKKIQLLAERITEDLNEDFKKHGIPAQMKGRRLQKRLISLVKACALREGRPYVLTRDVNRVRFLSRWMNLKRRQLPREYPQSFRSKEFD